MPQGKNPKPHFVILVGASAGGLKPLRTFLRNFKDLSDVSIIILQHLDPSGQDLALEVLKKITPAPVKILDRPMNFSAGSVYLLPPQHYLKTEAKKFFGQKARTKKQRFEVIDLSLKNLALGLGPRGIGVILSGEGNDGTKGIKILSKAGGFVIAQSPETAEHPSMPEHAIDTGLVDEVVIPEALGRCIRSFVKNTVTSNSPSISELQKEIGAVLPEICGLLRSGTRHDFKHYKTNTLIRRILRRMQIRQMHSVASYLEELKSSPKEVGELFHEVLVNVTSFFRDPEAFAALSKEVLEKHLNRETKKFRVWVPGCSTGEEVYSLSILIMERLEKLKAKPEVQIIATDLDEEALKVARKGVYPTRIEKSIPPKYLKKYFTKRDSKFYVRKDLREICLFSAHNLIEDPPFSHLDLISCRNLLIYLDAPLQKKVFPLFHYALKPQGHLFLGTSETFGTHGELFKVISSRHRIAQRRATAVKPPESFSLAGFTKHNAHFSLDSSDPNELHLICQRIILDEFAPRYMVINNDAQIVSNSQGIQEFLAPSEGAFQNSVLKLVRPELRMALRTTFTEARRHKRRITHETSLLHTDAGIYRICLSVQPMPRLGEDSPLFLVVFEKREQLNSKEVDKKTVIKTSDQSDLIEHLERELAMTRDDLDRTVQDLEASNEELKSSNEELLSMNEELQSSNEELETSKEEVQATNEALQKSFSDLENLLASTQVATLFLSNDLKINNFTPTIEKIYSVNRSDLGRSLTDFAHHALEMPAYPTPQEVRNLRTSKVDEVILEDGRIFQRRILPYKTFDDTLDGMVVTFVDISELKAINQRLQTLMNVIPQLIWTSLPDGNRDSFSQQWVDYTGIPEKEQIGMKWLELVVHPEDQERILKKWSGAIKGLNEYDVEVRLRRFDGEYRWFKARGIPVKDSRGEITYWFGTSTDIDAQIRLQKQVREEKIRYEYASKATFNIIWDWNLLTDDVTWNEAIHTQLGYPLEAMDSNAAWWYEHIHPEDRERVVHSIHEVIDSESGTHWSDEYRYQHADGHYIDVIDRGFIVRNADGNAIRMIGAMEDRTELKTKEHALEEKEAQYRSIFESSQDAIMIFDENGFLLESNPASCRMHGFTYEEMIGMTGKDFVHPDDLPEFGRFVEDVKAGRRFTVTARHVRKDGTPIDIDVVGSGFIYRGASALLAVVRDITERKKFEEEIRYQAQLTKTITDNAASCLFMMDKKGHPTFMNPAAMELTGYSSLDEIKDKPLHYAVHWKKPDGEYYPMEECPIDNAQAELKKVKNAEELFCKKDGTLFPVSYSITPLEKDGKVIGSVLEFRDITEEKRARKENEARELEFQTMANSIPQLGWMANPNGWIYWYNTRWYEYTGTNFEEMQGWGWEKVHHPDHIDRVVSFVKDAWTKPEPFELTFPLRSKSGEYRWFLTRAVPLLDNEGKITRWFGTNTDINEQLETAAALRANKQQLESVISTMEEGLVISDGTGKINLFNPAALRIHQFSSQRELIDHLDKYPDLFELTSVDDGSVIPLERWPLSRVLAGERVKNIEVVVTRKDTKHSFHAAYSGAPIIDEKGNVAIAVLTVADITHRFQAELELRDALRARDEFLSIASHELKTPLTSLMMQNQLHQRLISKEDPKAFDPDRIAKLSDTFDRLFRRLNRLIDDMLDIARIRTGKMNVIREETNLTSLVEEVVHRMKEEFRSSGFAEPTFEGDQVSAVVDPLRIEQVIANLLTNALRYGEGKPVSVKVQTIDSHARIEVRDQGRGIPKEDQKKIFSRFERAVSPSEISGLGLGLFIAEQIVLAHEGKIWVESEPKKGATFIVELPLKQDNSGDS